MEQLDTFIGIQPPAHLARQAAEEFPVASAMENAHIVMAHESQATAEAKPEICKSALTALYDHEAGGDLDGLKTGEELCNYQEELRQLSAQLLTIQESERQRIAADLHDGIGQSLSLIKLSLETVTQQLMAGESKVAVQSLGQLTQKVKETMNELHRATMDMRPSMLDDLGIIPTLSWFFREFESAWQDGKIEKDVSVAESDIPVSLKTT